MMSQVEIREFTRKVPFRPFRVFVTNGEIYDIHHPDMIRAFHDSVVVAAKTSGNFADRERPCHLSMFHIVKLEELPVPDKAPLANVAA